MTTTIDRSKQMNLLHEDLARAHSGRGPTRWRSSATSQDRLPRTTERAQRARLELARMLYGGAGR